MSTSGNNCPTCGNPLVAGVNYCCKCHCFVDPESGRVLEYGQVPDRQIEDMVEISRKALQEYEANPKRQNDRKKILMGVGGIVLAVIVMSSISVVLGLLLLVVGFIAMTRASRNRVGKPQEILEVYQFKDMISKYVLPSIILKEMDGVLEYEPKGHIPDQVVDESGLIYKPYNSNSGSQYVKGIYRGCPVQISNLSLREMVAQDQDVGNDNVHYKEKKIAFDGMWIVCETGRTIPADLCIYGKSVGYSLKHTILTDNEEFDQRFLVSSNDPEHAKSILSPELLDTIMRIDDRFKGKLYVKFAKGGEIYLGIDSDRRFMMANDIYEPLPSLKERMRQEVRFPLTLLDMIL